MVVHINNNRSIKGLLQNELIPRFQHAYPEFILEITPCVVKAVLDEAVNNNQIDKITLVKLDRPTDRADASNWVDAGTDAKIELRISAAERNRRLLGGLVQWVLGGDAAAYNQIVRFDGMSFDEAKVEVVLANGSRRTFNLEHPEGGHPFTADIAPVLEADGEPTEASIFAALDTVAEDVT